MADTDHDEVIITVRANPDSKMVTLLFTDNPIASRMEAMQQSQRGERTALTPRLMFVTLTAVPTESAAGQVISIGVVVSSMRLAHAQLSEHSPCVGQGAMQDLLDFADALSVQALLSLHRTKIHERVTEELLLLRRHRPSIQCPGISRLR